MAWFVPPHLARHESPSDVCRFVMAKRHYLENVCKVVAAKQYTTRNARGVDDHEPCDEFFVFDDIGLRLVDERDKGGGNEEERMHMETMSHPKQEILSLFFRRDRITE